MEFGGRLESALKYSDEVPSCDLCEDAGSHVTREATAYCEVCRHFLCKPCLRNHKSLNHKIIQGDRIYDVEKGKTTILPFQFCDQHRGKVLEHYCEGHEQLLCEVCLSNEHLSCKKVEQISVICRGIKRDQQVQTMSKDIVHLRAKIDDLQQKKETERSKISQDKKKCIDDIGCLRREIDMFFAKLESKMKSEAENTCATQTESISKHVTNLDEAKTKLESDLKNLKTSETLENEEQMFTAVKISKFKSIKNMIDGIEGDRSITMMEFNPHEKVRDLLDNVQSLGRIDISRIPQPSRNTTMTQKADHCQPPASKSEQHVDLRRRNPKPPTGVNPNTDKSSQPPATQTQEHKDPSGKNPQPSSGATMNTGDRSQSPATKSQELKDPEGKQPYPSTGTNPKLGWSSQPPRSKTQEHKDQSGKNPQLSTGAILNTGERSQSPATKSQELKDPEGKQPYPSTGPSPKPGWSSQPPRSKTQEHKDQSGKNPQPSSGPNPKPGWSSQPSRSKTQEHRDQSGKNPQPLTGATPNTGESSERPVSAKNQTRIDTSGEKALSYAGVTPENKHRPNDVKQEVIEKQDEFNVTDSSGYDIAIISGAVYLTTGDLVLCDNLNDSLKLLDRNHKLKSSVKVPGGLYGVAVVSDGELLVTRPGAKELQYFFVSKKGVLTPGRQIKVGRMCCGIYVHNENIYVTCHNNPGNGEVLMVTHGGKIGKRLGQRQDGTYMFARPDSVALNPEGDRIFVSDWEGNLVVCLTRNGHPLFTYMYTDPALRGPEGLFVNSKGEVFVCGGSSRNLHVIAKDGRQRDVIPLQEKGFPVSIAYRAEDRKIVVGFENSSAMIEYKLL